MKRIMVLQGTKKHRIKACPCLDNGENPKALMIRTCTACGRKKVRHELHRFVWSEGGPKPDVRQSLPGRGAYCCQEDSCRRLFLLQERKWKRVFRL
ncbi:MAG TPA: hypothetical protein DDY32_07490 [Desulfobulbaceae bacterium]|nr:hypothetical protein [Desulfobulbaceae bacterium]